MGRNEVLLETLLRTLLETKGNYTYALAMGEKVFPPRDLAQYRGDLEKAERALREHLGLPTQ